MARNNEDSQKYNSIMDDPKTDYEAGKEVGKGRKGDCWGFKSQDKKRRQRSYLICGVVSLLTLLVILLVLFLAIIPAMVKHLVDSSDIQIVTATIINPGETEFKTTALQKMTKSGPVDATVSMNDNLELIWEKETGENVLLAKLVNSESFKAKKNKEAALLTSTAKVVSADALAQFNAYLLTADKFYWVMKGSADVKAIVNVKDVKIDKKIEMFGFKNFETPPFIKSITVVKGDKDNLHTKVPTTMTSTSNVAIDFGQDVTFKLLYKDVAVGTGTIQNFNLQKEKFDVEPTVVLTPKTDKERELVNEMLTLYSNGDKTPVTMSGFATKEPVSWLAPSLANLKMATTMPGVTEKLITEIEMHPNMANLLKVPTIVGMYNALDAPVTITSLDSSVFLDGKKIGNVNQKVNIAIPAKGKVKSPELEADAFLGPETLSSVLELMGKGTGVVDVEATMELNVDGYPAKIQYKQKAVAASMKANH